MSREPKPDAVPFPTQGRLLGLDYGTKRVGVAVSNDEQTIASPLEIRHRQSREQDGQYLAKLARGYEIVGIIVGLPVHLSGHEGGKAHEARTFGAWVGQATGLPVRYHDERFTSVLAEQHLLAAELTKKRRKERLDKVAAQMLLQSYLDSTDRTAPAAPLRDDDATK